MAGREADGRYGRILTSHEFLYLGPDQLGVVGEMWGPDHAVVVAMDRYAPD